MFCTYTAIVIHQCPYFTFSADPKKTLHLNVMDGAKDRLHFFKASLLEEGSFDAAVDGCETVFHTASPFYHNVKDPKVCITTLGGNNRY
jgi:hypothetical protein